MRHCVGASNGGVGESESRAQPCFGVPSAFPPGFLQLPERPARPRREGLTHVLDKGCTLGGLQDLLRTSGQWIDIWKFGWGTSYVDPQLHAKVQLLRSMGIRVCSGGTLLEIAWRQGRVDAFFEFVLDAGFDCVEVSDGAIELPPGAKRRLIERARRMGLVVLAEVGSKDPAKVAQAGDWLAEVAGDIDAGAHWIVAEGRESGTVGLYNAAGAVHQSLLSLLAASPHAARIIYEAPQRAQQSVLLHALGSNVNLGNIALDDVLGLETLRLGLRADTLGIGLAGTEGDGVRV
ncbi:MAG: phosphosulfolactate synthase [Piscinibacter sp.]|nr:phosphosulfolactate synthase [Piscinibacter sp.]